VTLSGPTATPPLNSMKWLWPVAPYGEPQPVGEGVDHRHAHAVQAAGNLVELLSNLPPACSSVMTISAAERFCSSCSCTPVGMPRPLSTTLIELSV